MTFAEAGAFVLDFGKHQGRTIFRIAGPDDGIKYLDWLYDAIAGDSRRQATFEALDVYFKEPHIQKRMRWLR